MGQIGEVTYGEKVIRQCLGSEGILADLFQIIFSNFFCSQQKFGENDQKYKR